MLHRASSTRNDYEPKIDYDWPKYTPSQNFLTDSPVGL